MSRFSKPIIALILALAPFFLFFGTTNTVTVNGEIVQDSQFNLGGLLMGLIGLGIAFSVLRTSAPKDKAAKVLAAIAGFASIVQMANAVELVRLKPLDWIFPDRNLPQLVYSGLADNDKIFLSVKTPDSYRRALVVEKSKIAGKAMAHKTYADLCHGSRYRVELERASNIPDYLNADEITYLNKEADRYAKAGLTECSQANSNRVMGRETDETNRAMDLFDRLEKEYLASTAQ